VLQQQQFQVEANSMEPRCLVYGMQCSRTVDMTSTVTCNCAVDAAHCTGTNCTLWPHPVYINGVYLLKKKMYILPCGHLMERWCDSSSSLILVFVSIVVYLAEPSSLYLTTSCWRASATRPPWGQLVRAVWLKAWMICLKKCPWGWSVKVCLVTRHRCLPGWDVAWHGHSLPPTIPLRHLRSMDQASSWLLDFFKENKYKDNLHYIALLA